MQTFSFSQIASIFLDCSLLPVNTPWKVNSQVNQGCKCGGCVGGGGTPPRPIHVSVSHQISVGGLKYKLFK